MRKIMLLAATAVMLAAHPAFAQATNQTTGQAPRGAQPNSGAGVPGLPGGKSGPAVSPSGTAQPEQRTSPDQSGVQGLPGTKSGPAVQPPKSGQPR
jgi:hypothetical protein